MKKTTFVPVLVSLLFLIFIETAFSNSVTPQPYNAVQAGGVPAVNLNWISSAVKQNAQPMSQTASNELNYVWLNLTGADGMFCQLAFGYRAEATNGVDDYDSTRIDGQFTLSTLIEASASDYVIQSRAMPFSVDDIVKLSFRTPVAGTYTIAVSQTMGLFSEGQDIIITDRLTGTVHNLRTSSYTFTSAVCYETNRFSIVYQNPAASATLSNASLDLKNEVVVFKKKTDLFINANSKLIKKVTVLDMNGRLLLEQNNINQNDVMLSVAAIDQVLIVNTVLEEGQIITKKIL